MRRHQFFWSLLFVITSTAMFFFATFNFDNPTSSAHSYYLSEIVCRGADHIDLCSNTQPSDVRLFRGDNNEPILTPSYWNNYVSSSFGKFLRLFLSEKSTLRGVVITIFLVKSVVIASLLLLTAHIAARFKNTHHLVAQLLIVLFSVPYIIFGASSVYPAPIASIALVPVLTSMCVLESSNKLNRIDWLILASALIFGISVIVTNRFETSMILGVLIFVGLLIKPDRDDATNFLPRRMLVISSYGILLIFVAITNSVMRRTIGNAFRGKAQILSTDVASTSAAFRNLGDAGLSVTAPLTLIDNTTRNISRQFGDESVEQASGAWRTATRLLLLLIQTLGWYPLVVIVGCSVVAVLRLFLTKSRLKSAVVRPGLCILLFFLIPAIARAPAFLWYVLPILLAFVFSSNQVSDFSSQTLKTCGVVLLTVNILAVFQSSVGFGSLFIWGQEIKPVLLAVIVSLNMFIAILSFYRLMRQDLLTRIRHDVKRSNQGFVS